MSKRTKLGLNVLEAALLLGVLGNALLRETPWGLNVFLWTGALALAMYALHVRAEARASWRVDGGWLFLPVVFFAAAFAWRDSPTLNFLDGLALFVSLALLAWRARGQSIRLARLVDYVLGLGHAAFDALFACLPLVFTDVQWATIPRHGAMRHAWSVARGLIIAVPLLFLFGALLMAADAVFAGIMQRTFQFDSGVLFSHLFLTLMFAWLAGGFLRGMTLGEAAVTQTTGTVSTPAPAPASPVPHIYTSITIDDKRDEEAGGHRQPPGSVVVDGGALAEGKSVEDEPHERDAEKPPARDAASPQVEGADAQAQVEGTDAQTQADAQTQVDAAAERPQALNDAGGETREQPVSAAQEEARGFSLGAVEVGVVLGLLNVLFASFVVVQFRYFFGGAERVMSITELTYSEYARRGFFELTWVAGLVLPLLLGAHALLRKDSRAAARIFRWLAGAQIGLLFIIMASAVARMRLYQTAYGLTELRFYTMAFMLWLGLVFIWFSWTVLVRCNRQRFACGALVAAFVTLGLLHLINPDAYIVRANVAHARVGRSFDAAYAASLSADAVPALISTLPALNRNERCLAASELTRRWTPTWLDEDWRGWNFARWRARRTVSTHREALKAVDCPPPPSTYAPITTSAPVSTPDGATEPPPPPAPVTATTNTSTTINDARATNSNAPAATNSNVPAATNSNASAAQANGATPVVTTMPMINETKVAPGGAPNTQRSTRTDRRQTKRHERTRAARRTKER